MVVCTQMRVQNQRWSKMERGFSRDRPPGATRLPGAAFRSQHLDWALSQRAANPTRQSRPQAGKVSLRCSFEERRGRLAMRSRHGRVELYASWHVEAAAEDNRLPGGEYGHLVQKPPRLDRNYKLVRRWLAGSRSTIRRLTLESAARFLSLSVRPADY